MPWLFVAAAAALVAIEPPAGSEPLAADVVVLRDGQEVLGQVLEPAPAGYLLLAVRRAWAVQRRPEWAIRWLEMERPIVMRARWQRRQRLDDWRRERGGPADSLTAWIDRERASLARLDPPPTPLLPVYLARDEVRSQERRPEATARLLRLGWLLGLPDVETMTERELKAVLRRRGVRLESEDPALIERLLPVLPEPEPLWRARRAVTEVWAEPALRLISFRGLLLPEHASETPEGTSPWPQAYALDTPAALAAFGALLRDTPADAPLAPAFDAVQGRGRIGLLVTQVDIPAELEDAAGAATAVATLWVRQAEGGWTALASQSQARPVPAAVPAVEEAALEGDSPIPGLLMVIQSVAGHPPLPGTTSVVLAAGVAADRAGRQARRELARRLERLVLPTAPRR